MKNEKIAGLVDRDARTGAGAEPADARPVGGTVRADTVVADARPVFFVKRRAGNPEQTHLLDIRLCGQRMTVGVLDECVPMG
jgi:hypothetical protein